MLIRYQTLTALLLLVALLCSCTKNRNDELHLATTARIDKTGIAGRITDGRGKTAIGAYVYAYRNMRSNLRGPADFEAKGGQDGHYFLDLVEGNYYLVARMRQSGADAGPPKPGDAWALPPGNPVKVLPGEVTVVNFILQGVAQPMLMREGTLTSGDTGFSGLLVDPEGKPLPGAFVIAYPDTDFQRMPEATSPSVGDDGRFHLYVERPGQWCLAARTRTRGQPVAGEPYGKLGEQQSGCRTAEPGQLIDVGTIRLTPYRQ